MPASTRKTRKKRRPQGARKPFNRDAFLRRYLGAALSRIWGWYPPRREAKDRGEREGCAACKKKVARTQIDVDHIEPVVPVDRIIPEFVYWSSVIDRRFCEPSNLQPLCKPCHKKKTNEENSIRRRLKKNG